MSRFSFNHCILALLSSFSGAILGCAQSNDLKAPGTSRNGTTPVEIEQASPSEVSQGTPDSEFRTLTLLEYLRHSQAEEHPITPDELVDRSATIATGKITSVSEGRVLDFASGPSHPVTMSLMHVDVSGILKGNHEQTSLSFEFITGGAPLDAMNKALPPDEFLFFLRESTRWDNDTYVSDERRKGLAPGEPLLELTSQQGMLMETDGSVVSALNPSGEALFVGTSLNEVGDDIGDREGAAIPARGAD